MKRQAGWLMILVLIGAMQAMAAGLITKQQAEQDALNAVGGGTVISAARDDVNRTPIWSVDIVGATHEYEVWVNAHTGAILKIIAQPLAPASKGLISKQQAEQEALNAVGGGTVLQAVLDTNMGRRTWSVDILGSASEYEVWVDAHSAAVLKIITQPLAAQNCAFIPKAKAEQIALAAVGANKVLAVKLETQDHPIVWSVDAQTAQGTEYEVQVNACTGKVVAIIPGG